MILLLSLLLAAGAERQSLAGDAIEQHVRDALVSRLDAARRGTRFEFTAAVADQSLPAGRADVQVGDVAGRWPRTRFAVPVRLQVDGATVKTLSVWVSARDTRTALRYAQNQRAGAFAPAIAVETGEVDVACCAGEPMDALPAARDARLTHAVRKGDPVMSGDFETSPPVAARESVRIETGRGAIRLAMPGTALVDGHIGERITVRTQAGSLLAARVTGQGEVEIDE